jgi:hypothetical protein
MKHLARRIQASNYLYFTLDSDGTGHNKPQYITMQCKNILIRKVLIDNCSTLNILPRYMSREMLIDGTHETKYHNDESI